MNESWAPIEGFPMYAISNHGEVCNTARNNRLLKPAVNRQGLPMVGLMDENGRHTNRSISLLVAKAFVAGENQIFNCPINLDGDRLNCHEDNLLWRPRWFAVSYHRQFHVPEFHQPSRSLIEEITEGRLFDNYKQPAIMFGLRYVDIVLSCFNKTDTFPTGHKFRFFQN